MIDVLLSKKISHALRHHPTDFGLTLDAQGWVPVEDLIAGLTAKGWVIDITILEEIVSEDDRGRYTIREGMIRANQGHSVVISLGLEPVEPPEFLFHGTIQPFVDSIRVQGLLPMNLHAVHLSENRGLAEEVGQRNGKPVVLRVNSGLMFAAGYEFTRTENNVWLTNTVPPEFIIFD